MKKEQDMVGLKENNKDVIVDYCKINFSSLLDASRHYSLELEGKTLAEINEIVSNLK